jgi:molybdopterin-binding protein
MKLKSLTIVFLLFGFAKNAIAQSNIPERKVTEQPTVTIQHTKVLSAVITNDSTIHLSNGTAYHNYFKATISSIGTGTVNFKWIITNSSPQSAPLIIPGTITLNSTGTDYIYLQKSSGRGPVFYKLSLQVETPNQILSNTYGYN